jgi:hypothetical protein
MARKGELSIAALDRSWPHQVAIPADECTGAIHVRIAEVCQGLSIAPRTISYVEGDRYMTVFCFADLEHAEAFANEFGGTIIHPKQRPRWPGR